MFHTFQRAEGLRPLSEIQQDIGTISQSIAKIDTDAKKENRDLTPTELKTYNDLKSKLAAAEDELPAAVAADKKRIEAQNKARIEAQNKARIEAQNKAKTKNKQAKNNDD